ncbi:MAG: exo-alpha-sialidase [Gemmatimonadota bacterium]|nr:exo-alpha-sialidase [Gemmatimonadota bacterium]
MSKRVLSNRAWTSLGLAAVALLTVGARPPAHPPVRPALLSGLVWRNVGPLRGGRVAAVTGAIGEAGVFYFGSPAGGAWKTTNAGITWTQVFDSVKSVSSVGAIEVAPSDTNVVYIGTGDIITGGAINEGNGVWKSTDAGKSWRHMGLDDSKQIPSIMVDPSNPDLVLVAAQGNVHKKSDQRGVFRSTDGGRTWTRTLFVNDEVGAVKLAYAHDKPSVILATTDEHYVPPASAERGAFGGPNGTHLFKSTDEGLTWTEISGHGLPELSGRTSVAVANHTDGQRMFVIGNWGLYRSDDGGATWRQMDAEDARIRNGQGGYNCGVYVSPENPDVVYTINTSSYVSRDGGNTFTGFKGAPGGDDPQQLWIDPTNGQRMLLGMDQGGTVTLDGGKTWSEWYNQSTEQVYHLSVDNSYPYWIYAPQQDAGAIRVRSRGNFGEITPLDWNPVGGWEWGSIIADPLNPNMVYATGAGVIRIAYPSEQTINVSPSVDPNLHLRATSTNPLVWAPWNQHRLMVGFQYLMATTDGGAHWAKMSPDLGYPKGVKPPPENEAFGRGRGGRGGPPPGGSIESISPSTAKAGVIWVGTNNGPIKLTRDDGKTWEDVSIPNVPDSIHADISAIDASHSNPAEAYVAVDGHTVGDYAPYFYRTRDYGKTWTEIVNGLPTDQASGSFARVIRNDTEKPGLLFAGTESGMYVSFDDGDQWQSLQLNLPTTSYRDAVIKGNDLVVGTYGRGIWILDDISPLRQMTAAIADEPAHLFKPGNAIRVRRNVNQDTPFPPEVPHSLNAPNGVLVYYSLGAEPRGEITLDVLDAAGHVVHHYSSAPITPVPEAAHPPEPNFWLAVPQPLATGVGAHRMNWDLRYDAPPAFAHSFEINANPELTPASPRGPLALPGTYTFRLTVDGRTYTQTASIANDPRSPASLADLRAQHALAMQAYDGARTAWDGYEQGAALRGAVAKATAGAPEAVANAAKTLLAQIDSAAGAENGGGRGFGFRRGGFGAPPANFRAANGSMIGVLGTLDPGDFAPNPPMRAQYVSACTQLRGAAAHWQQVIAKDLPAFNAVLKQNGLAPVAAPKGVALPSC